MSNFEQEQAAQKARYNEHYTNIYRENQAKMYNTSSSNYKLSNYNIKNNSENSQDTPNSGSMIGGIISIIFFIVVLLIIISAVSGNRY